MEKTYLRYSPETVLGQIYSCTNIEMTGKLCFVGANESVLCINTAEGRVVATMKRDDEAHSAVTVVWLGRKRAIVVAGYSDGSLFVFDRESFAILHSFSFHTAAITTIAMDAEEYVCFSGSKDTTIVAYDLIASTSLYKLTRHKDAITELAYYSYGRFSEDPVFAKFQDLSVLISTSKDSVVRIWDVKGQYSIDSSLAFSGPISVFAIAENYLIVASNNEVLKVYELKIEQNGESFTYFSEKGEIRKASKERTIRMQYLPHRRVLLLLSADGALEIFKRNQRKDIAKKILRTKKRRYEKIKTKGELTESERTQMKKELKESKDTVSANVLEGKFDIKYLFTSVCAQQFGKKAKSFEALKKDSGTDYRLLLGFSTNQLEMWNLKISKKKPENLLLIEDEAGVEAEFSTIQALGWEGHQTPIRVCVTSSNDQSLVTASTECVKIWNINSHACIKSLDIENVVSGVFLPGDKYLLAGSKEGFLYLIDIVSTEVIQKIEGHSGEVWSLSLHANPDFEESDLCIVSGAADKSLKLWSLTYKKEGSKKRLALLLLKKIETTDDVLCSMISPNGKLLAFSLLDSTIKILFVNSLKFYLSLYGHKLPVLSFDISSDNSLLVSGSSDKNIIFIIHIIPCVLFIL